MTHIPPETLEDLKTGLEAELAALQEELSERGVKTGDSWDAMSGLEGEEADSSDAADQIEELVTNVPMVEELKKREKEIKGAIRRMGEGSYGTCEECGEEIALDRLEANPAAATCIRHAE
ncbi:MAG: hypothetical protein RIQ56_804 [Candidatus Parcubacteria bacterium]